MTNFQVVDAAAAHVVEENDIYLHVFGNGSWQFGMKHHISVVTDQCIDFTVRFGHLYPQSSIYFIPHAGKAVLYMIAAYGLSPPCPLKVTRQTAGSANDNGIFVDGFIHRAQHRGLGQAATRKLDEFLGYFWEVKVIVDFGDEIFTSVFNMIKTIYFLIISRLGCLYLCLILGRYVVAGLAQCLIQHLKSCTGVTYHLQAVHLVGMELAHIDIQVLHIRILVNPLGRSGEVRIAGADADNEIGISGDGVRAQSTSLAQSAKVQRVLPGDGALACLGFAKGNAVLLSKFTEGILCFGILHAAAKDHDGFLLAAYEFHCLADSSLGWLYTVDVMHPFLEEVFRIIPGFPFDILRQGNADCTGICRVCQHPHGIDAGRHENFRTGHTIPVFAYSPKSVIGRHRKAVGLFHLLQHRVRLAVSIGIAGQEQHGNAVGRGGGSGCYHIGSAGTYRRSAGVNLFAALLLGIAHSSMSHALFIAAHMHDKMPGILFQSLPQPHHIAVTKNTKNTGKHRGFFSVKFDVLIIEKLHQSLCYSESDRLSHIKSLLKGMFNVSVPRFLPEDQAARYAPAGHFWFLSRDHCPDGGSSSCTT